MTEKRFTDIEHDYENAWIKCKDDGDFMIYAIYGDLDESLPSLGDLLNGLDGTIKDLSDENKQLKHRIKKLQNELNNYSEICNELNALVDDNEQLKQQFNYIQNSISEHIKHQKTELGQKALREIIEDYNEWLLGHKRL